MSMELLGIKCEPRSFKLAFRDDAAVDIAEINEEILDSLGKYGIKAVLAYTDKGRAVTFEELARNGMEDGIPSDGSETIKVLHFDFLEGRLFVLTRHSAIPLSRLKLTLSYRMGERAAPRIESDQKILEPELDEYTADVFVKIKDR